MAVYDVEITGKFDTSNNNLTLQIRLPEPPPPPGYDVTSFTVQSTQVYEQTFRLNKATQANEATAIYPTLEDGLIVWREVVWANGAWQMPGTVIQR